MTHTEKAHVLFGIGLAVMGACALRCVWRPESRTRSVWPVLIFLIGVLLFVPVETQGRTYQEVGWWEVLGSFIPDDPSRWLSDWIAMAGKRHVWQHKLGASLAMAAGLIEFLRGRGRLPAAAWGFALPTLCAGVGAAFGLHGGTATHLSHPVEQLHHQVLGVAFALAGVTLALAQAGRLPGPWWRGLWAILVMAVGLDLAVFYRLAPHDVRQEAHHDESPRTR